MLTEFQRRKLTRAFNNYDANRDGYVERGDYEKTAQGIADYLELPIGSAEREKHTIEFMAGWRQLQQAADHDNDNRVTLEEFLAVNDYVLAHREIFETLIMSTAQNLMNWQDKDKDGRVSWAEFLGNVTIFGQTPAEAEEAFRHLDRDQDGYLNTEEWLRNTEEFFMSDDPNAPGNWLLGPY